MTIIKKGIRLAKRFKQVCPLKTLRAIFFFSCSIVIISCSAQDHTPEAIIKTFVERTTAAIEERDRSALAELIDENYTDSQGRKKNDLLALAAGYMLRNRSLYCYSIIDSFHLNEDESISATILSAFAARPISDVHLLTEIRSDIYWFEITIVDKDNDWRLIAASWRQALVDDFF